MQPNQSNEDWRQPTEQPSNPPIPTGPSAPPSSPPAPVATVTPTEVQSAPPVVVTPTTPSEEPSVAPQQPTEQQPKASPQVQEQEPVRWQATEYIQHDKSPVWFILFAIVVIGLIAVAIFLLQSITFAILVPVMAAAILVYTHRPPRLLDYTLSRQGLHINDRLYPFAEFKGFGVIHDGFEYSVMLLPVQRFKPGVSVYFPEEAGEAIVDMLGARLPMQELHLDAVDKIIRKLRI